jgi:hypothetical protein
VLRCSIAVMLQCNIVGGRARATVVWWVQQDASPKRGQKN